MYHIYLFIRNGFLLIFGLLLLTGCAKEEKDLSVEQYLQAHVDWLAAGEREGRLAGTIHEADAANYISDLYQKYGLMPVIERMRYIQQFELTGPLPQLMGVENHLSRNVIGAVPGLEHPERYMIVGAHYDGQGWGGLISLSPQTEPEIHHSADDNASGTAGLLWLARQFAENPARNTLIFAAFSGEELGLIGSRYFVSNLEIPKDSVMAMINLDMIGRLEEGKLDIFGTGTSAVWNKLLDDIDADSLTISRIPGGMGSSDHASFYEAGIPVLHYYSGTHQDYHRPGDTADKINFTGMKWILEHVETIIRMADSIHPDEIAFMESTDPRPAGMRRDGIGLGIIPDYRFEGTGLRIDQVRVDATGDLAGIMAGDIVIRLGNEEIRTIYDYMNVMNRVEKGDELPVVVLRNGDPIELTVIF